MTLNAAFLPKQKSVSKNVLIILCFAQKNLTQMISFIIK